MSTSKILIAEDEIFIARELEARLKDMGYDVPAIASTGTEAILLAQEVRPDLILMDTVLKGEMDGIEAGAEIQRHFQVPIIYLTAYTDERTLDRAKEMEPYGYLVKPFSERDLHANIEMALYKHRTEIGLRRMERWFAAAVDKIDDAVITADPEGCIATLNPSAEVLTGWKRSQAIGRKLDEVLRLIHRTNDQAVSLEQVSSGPLVLLSEETLLLDQSGEKVLIDCTISALRDEEGRQAGTVAIFHESASRMHDSLDALNKEIAFTAAQALTLQGMLQLCAEAMARHLNAALARIWTLNAAGDALILQASAGLEITDGTFNVIPIGKFKAGRIAREKQPLLDRELLFDPAFSDPEWARREKLVAFAGYPLLVEGRLVGVMAIFSRRSLPEVVFKTLDSVSHTMALGIERKWAEAELQASRERLEIALESGHIGLWDIDFINDTVFFSPQWYQLFGYKEGEIDITSDGWNKLIHPEDLPSVLAEMQQLIEGEIRSFQSECRMLHKDGSYRWILTAGTIYHRPDGTAYRMVGSNLDITERKRDQEALQKERDFISAVVDTVGNLVVVLDRQGRIIRFNRACEQLSGYSFKEVRGRNFLDLFLTPGEKVDVTGVFEDMKAGQFPNTHENDWVARDGSRRRIAWANTALLDSEGSVEYLIGTGNDITERNRTEQALQESQSQLRALVESLDEIVFEFDAQGTYVNVWCADETLLARPRSELIGRRVEEILGEAMAAPFVEVFRGVISNVRAESMEYEMEVESGKLWFLARICPIIAANGRCETVCMLSRNITPLKQAEIALQKANEELETRVEERTQQLRLAMEVAELARESAERANLAKSEFLSRMSHELRTPMNSILGFAQIMERSAENEKQAQRIQYILKAGNHLLQLINEVLDLSHLEGGRLHLSLEPVALHQSIQEAVNLVLPLCQQRNQQLSVDWNGCESLYVLADQQRLAQVLLNLLSNAHKYNHDGGGIHVSCERKEKRLRIRIADTGPGIAPELSSRLFQPFERLNVVGGTTEGTGLGLVLSRGLIEVMHGAIGVESVPGEGSTFWIELPQSNNPVQRTVVTNETGMFQSLHLREFTLLSIEDNSANLKVIEHVLENDSNIKLISALQGKIGIDLAREHHPSLILLDYNLPDLPGDDVLRRLKSDPATRSIPVIVVSADATPNQIQRLKTLGASDYLTKPLNIPQFIKVVYKFLLSRSEEV